MMISVVVGMAGLASAQPFIIGNQPTVDSLEGFELVRNTRWMSSCTPTWYKSPQELDQLRDLSCPTKPLRGFKLMSDVEMAEMAKHPAEEDIPWGCGGVDRRWQHDCGGGATMDPEDYEEYFTDCAPLQNKDISFMKSHQLKCPAGSVMWRWMAQPRNECDGDGMRFAYSCAKAQYTEEIPLETNCAQTWGWRLQYLDRHNVECFAGTAIKEWGVSTEGCENGQIKIKYTCVDARKPVPSVAPTAVPTIAPSRSPTAVPTKAPITATLDPPTSGLVSFEQFLAACNESDPDSDQKACKEICGGSYKKGKGGKCKKPNGAKRVKCRSLNGDRCLVAHCSGIKYDNGKFKKCAGKASFSTKK